MCCVCWCSMQCVICVVLGVKRYWHDDMQYLSICIRKSHSYTTYFDMDRNQDKHRHDSHRRPPETTDRLPSIVFFCTHFPFSRCGTGAAAAHTHTHTQKRYYYYSFLLLACCWFWLVVEVHLVLFFSPLSHQTVFHI